MKLGVVGSRYFTDEGMFADKVLDIARLIGVTKYVTGDCDTGADAMCRRRIEEDWIVNVHEADWDRYRKSAGPIRNQKIIDESDELVAFLVEGAECKGTWDSIRKAVKKGIPIHIYVQKKV